MITIYTKEIKADISFLFFLVVMKATGTTKQKLWIHLGISVEAT